MAAGEPSPPSQVPHRPRSTRAPGLRARGGCPAVVPQTAVLWETVTMLFPSFRRHAETPAERKRPGRSRSASSRPTARRLWIELLEDRMLSSSSFGFGWSLNVGGPDHDEGFGITTDGQGNVYVAGYFKGTNVNFDPRNATPSYLSA